MLINHQNNLCWHVVDFPSFAYLDLHRASFQQRTLLFAQELCVQYRNYWVRGSDLCRDIGRSNDCSSLIWPWNLWISIPEGPYAIDASINGTSGWLPGGKTEFQFREWETLALAQLLAKGHFRWHAVLTTSCSHEVVVMNWPFDGPSFFLLSSITISRENLRVHTSLYVPFPSKCFHSLYNVDC